MAYVIKDGENYVSGNGTFILTNEGHMYISYTGKATGFCYFTNQQQAEKEKGDLQKICNKYGFDKEFSIKYIDIKNISIGKMIMENLPSKKLVNL